ncbi:hypothetical protein QYF36_019638 [Acer negundo]|nr:hypothetical protein QYF36_019638 [Acer negundo]
MVDVCDDKGDLEYASLLFKKVNQPNLFLYNALIRAYTHNHVYREAVDVYKQMLTDQKRLWNEGLMYFDSMRKDYHIEPGVEHYGCLVDLLGRSGRLDQALDIIKEMPMKPDSKTWGSLLSSCRTYSNLEIAVIAMEHLLEIEPEDTGNYVLLSNIYADFGKWEAVSRLRKLVSKSMKKTPGCSLIEVNNEVQEFLSGDDRKPFSEDIFWLLELLASHQDLTKDMIDIMTEDTSE